jgi:hypothetical protein
MVDLIKVVEDNDTIIKYSLQEQSYEMSPYWSDDDEDEDVPNNKFMPSWASKHSLSMIISSQKMDQKTISLAKFLRYCKSSFASEASVIVPTQESGCSDSPIHFTVRDFVLRHFEDMLWIWIEIG